MADVPRESDVLVPFEIANIPTEYRDYYGTKRQNMFATIQKHPAFWTYFHMLDQIMYREIKDLEVSTDPTNHLPRIFFINAHAKVRIAIELAFQGCIQECRSILRDAVEWAAFGHYLNSDPALQTIWWEQHQPAGKSAYKAQFVDNKRLTLFAGQDELYQKFRQLSDAGSHPTPMSLSGRLNFTETATTRGMSLHYAGIPDEKAWATEVFSRLLTCFVIEQTFFTSFQTRLQLDYKLMDMRREFDANKEALRRFVITKYNMKDPGKQSSGPRAADAPTSSLSAGKD
jgi:hypothetical protein